MFVGRRAELAALGKQFDAPGPALVIVYGRRRVGKSTLLLKALEGRPAVYFQATRLSDPDNLAMFKAEVRRSVATDPEFEGLAGWAYVLAALVRLAARIPGLTVVLDEFPYLCDANPALPSILQKAWDDATRARARLNLVLCGSSIAFMQSTLAERNPLYGRQSAVLEVMPLGLSDVAQFFDGWTPVDIVRAYAVFGGMPYYLARCDAARSLAANAVDLVLADGAPLREEPQFLLQAELRDVARYGSILRAIADGCTKRGEIANRVVPSERADTINAYLHKLVVLRLIRQVSSVADAGFERRRNHRYFLADAFLAFYHRFVLPYLSAIERGDPAGVYREVIAPRLDEYVSTQFEELSRQHLWTHAQEMFGAGALPLQVGQIWLGGDNGDIDVAARLAGDTYVYGECKWSRKHVGISALDALVAASRLTPFGAHARRRYYVLFSRSGFSPALIALAQKQHDALRLVAPADMMRPARANDPPTPGPRPRAPPW